VISDNVITNDYIKRNISSISVPIINIDKDIWIYNVALGINWNKTKGLNGKPSLDVGETTMNLFREMDPDWAKKIEKNIEESKKLKKDISYIDPVGKFKEYTKMKLIDKISNNYLYVGGWSKFKNISEASSNELDKIVYDCFNYSNPDVSYKDYLFNKVTTLKFMVNKIKKIAPKHYNKLYYNCLIKSDTEFDSSYIDRIYPLIKDFYDIAIQYEYNKNKEDLKNLKNKLIEKFPEDKYNKNGKSIFKDFWWDEW